MHHRPDSVPTRWITARVSVMCRQPGMPNLLGLTTFLLAAGILVLVMARTPVVLVVSGFFVVWVVGKARSGSGGAEAAPPVSHPEPQSEAQSEPRTEAVWLGAAERFAALRAAYAAHECDPMAVLRLPALSDVTVPSTARFIDAFAEAQALATETVPPDEHATGFVAAVGQAERTWQAACDAAERIRVSHLSPDERRAVDRVVKLLTTARDSDNDAERLVAYARARAELARLDRAGVIHLPRRAAAALAAASRSELTA